MTLLEQLPAEAGQRLQRYSHEVVEVGFGDKTDITEACEVTIAFVQQQLHARKAGIDAELAIALAYTQDWALHPIREWLGDGYAKEMQKRLSPDEQPLAVCLSGRSRVEVETKLGTYEVSGVGCFRVFEDAIRPSGVMFPRLCPICRDRNTKRNEARVLKRKVKMVLAARAERLRK